MKRDSVVSSRRPTGGSKGRFGKVAPAEAFRKFCFVGGVGDNRAGRQGTERVRQGVALSGRSCVFERKRGPFFKRKPTG